MTENNQTEMNSQEPSEKVGPVPNASEQFGTIPHHSEPFRTVPNNSESFRTLRNRSERRSAHTLTVKEVARMFEAAGVSRTERSIVKWCQPNRHDLTRLDAFFDSNERKWFITQESVELAIAEEQARAARRNEAVPNDSEPDGSIPKGSESPIEALGMATATATQRVKELETQVLDLKILNGGKDFLIDQLRKERDGFLTQLVDYSRHVGQLENKLHQLQEPQNGSQESTQAEP